MTAHAGKVLTHQQTLREIWGLSAGMGTNWTTLPGSDQTNQFSIPFNPANGSVFVRLVYP
jgi:hypothetical protein